MFAILAAYIQLHTYEPGDAGLFEVCGERPGCVVQHGNVCDVHVWKPQAGYPQDLVVLWHELRHCFYGKYH